MKRALIGMSSTVIALMLSTACLSARAADEIPANEKAAMAATVAFAEGEEIYHRTDYNRDGVLEYAQVLGGRAEDFKRMHTEPVKVEKPSDDDKVKIEKLIKTLNDDDFGTREKAMTELQAFGSKAYEQAGTAAKNSADAEVTQRCKKLVQSIEDAGAPAPQIKLAYQFGLLGSNGQAELALIDKPLAAAECAAGCDPGQSTPRKGYFFRVLTRQGEAATGGKRDYIVNGHMTLGYGLLAFPADYGTTGKRCFMINSNGTIFERDFGSKKATDDFVKSCVEFNPTGEWAAAR
jgi:hypothetical protein